MKRKLVPAWLRGIFSTRPAVLDSEQRRHLAEQLQVAAADLRRALARASRATGEVERFAHLYGAAVPYQLAGEFDRVATEHEGATLALIAASERFEELHAAARAHRLH